MKKVLTSKQLENMIIECVNSVINETAQLKQSNKPQRVSMNEGQLKKYIANIINEEIENEGWFGDKWKQAKSGVGTFMNNSNGDKSLGQHFQAAKKNWSTQGELNNLQNLKDQLIQYVENGKINPQMTIAQLVGGKYNDNKLGKLTSQIANRKSQISKRGSMAY